MNNQLKSALTFAAAMLVAGAVHAHDCSGGAGGGMDATGNDCGVVADVVASTEVASAAAVGHPVVTAAAKTTPSNPTVATNRTGHTKHQSHVRHVSASKGRA
jgi:hypothetical protein